MNKEIDLKKTAKEYKLSGQGTKADKVDKITDDYTKILDRLGDL